MKIYSDITQTIGNTPLVKLQRLNQGLKAELFLKLEFFNPLGSVKDRIGLNLIAGAEQSEKLKPGMTVIEPTSGNTGISLAFVCAAKGYPITIVMPETMSQERRTLLLLLGAELILTPGPMGMRGAIAKAMEIADSNPKYFMPRQFENPDNPIAHEKTTALEIWNDTDGKVDMVVSGIGTGGTITGVGKILKQKNSNIKMIAVEPTESPILSGGKPSPHKIQGIGAGFIPPILNMKIIDQIEQVSSDEALATAKKVIKTEGIPVGISSGAAIAVGLRLAALEENKGKNIVVIVPSYTERYLSTLLADPERSQAQALVTSTVNEDYLKKVPVQEGV